ncbi:MAG TPA: DUF885 family protein [Vicinamibacterales bacterium]|nr:DUF885 family protein [Vicinamibacterales bacterium]
MRHPEKALFTLFCAALLFAAPALAQAPPRAASYVPDPWPLEPRTASELRDTVERYRVDRVAMQRRWSTEHSPETRAQFRAFFRAWRDKLAQVPFEKLSQDGKADLVLLRNRLDYDLKLLDRLEKLLAEAGPLMPYAATIASLHDARRRMEPIDPKAAAATLARMNEEIAAAQKSIEGTKPSRIVALRAANMTDTLRRTFEQWFRFYDLYDPLFSWWVEDPYKRASTALATYTKFLREKIVGYREGEDEPIVGDPIGRAALLEDLAYEMIPYTPEELIEIANKEYAWCEAEMKKASRELGFGDDWKKALEAVKNKHVEPGRQTALVKQLADEAIAFVEQRGLVTVPPLAKDLWRMEMMAPERQKVNPFFLGGETIQVSYPTDTMEHEDKLMSMRGNNTHFSRATVHHELIPGHHLQGFMTDRYNSHRDALSNTPFWGEGWALYWEMVLWDAGFPKTPEDRIGMLFWRMHRTARIIFSLSFHLGKMSPQECIDLLVDRVGHERFTAEGEVRRSFNGSYSPLYQVAYMIGGLQFRALHREMVGSKQMNDRQFHDTILRLGQIPVEMVRAIVQKQPLPRDFRPSWRFYGG